MTNTLEHLLFSSLGGVHCQPEVGGEQVGEAGCAQGGGRAGEGIGWQPTPSASGNSIPAPHPPDSPPAEQLQQLLAEAGLAEVCMSACVYLGGGGWW